jgi:hypothetical protein
MGTSQSSNASMVAPVQYARNRRGDVHALRREFSCKFNRIPKSELDHSALRIGAFCHKIGIK